MKAPRGVSVPDDSVGRESRQGLHFPEKAKSERCPETVLHLSALLWSSVWVTKL